MWAPPVITLNVTQWLWSQSCVYKEEPLLLTVDNRLHLWISQSSLCIRQVRSIYFKLIETRPSIWEMCSACYCIMQMLTIYLFCCCFCRMKFTATFVMLCILVLLAEPGECGWKSWLKNAGKSRVTELICFFTLQMFFI